MDTVDREITFGYVAFLESEISRHRLFQCIWYIIGLTIGYYIGKAVTKNVG